MDKNKVALIVGIAVIGIATVVVIKKIFNKPDEETKDKDKDKDKDKKNEDNPLNPNPAPNPAPNPTPKTLTPAQIKAARLGNRKISPFLNLETI